MTVVNPCPLCGRPPEVNRDIPAATEPLVMVCQQCGLICAGSEDSRESAITLWNRLGARREGMTL
jgi:hypothetical protein